MKTTIPLILLGFLAASPALAQATAPVVEIKLTADMPSLVDPKKKDLFTVELKDAQVVTKLELNCQAGRTAAYGFQTIQRGCAVGGNGSIVGPGGVTKPRTQYKGGFFVNGDDGSTAADTMEIAYHPLGKVPSTIEKFKGSMNLKPKLTAGGSNSLRDSILKKLQNAAGAEANASPIDNRTDTIKLNRFFVPSAGFPSDKGTFWTGTLVWAYETETWYIDVEAGYTNEAGAEQRIKLKGNMPWTDSPGDVGTEQLDLTLTTPGKDAFGDEALFASATGDTDLFATVDGIQGQIILTPGSDVKVTVDGKTDEIPGSYPEGKGSFTGTNIPLTVVRSFATVVAVTISGLLGG